MYPTVQEQAIGKWPKMDKQKAGSDSFTVSFRNHKLSMTEVTQGLSTWLGLNSDYHFKEVSKQFEPVTSFTHLKVQLYYKGVPVSGKLMMIHAKEDRVMSVNGQYIMVNDLDMVARLSKEEAAQKAKSHLKVKNTFKLHENELVVFTPSAAEKQQSYLAYEIRIDSYQPFFMMKIWVDAQSGTILDEVSLVAHSSVPGTGQTYYYGQRPIAVEQFEEGFRLRDPDRNIATFDGENTTYTFNQSNWELDVHDVDYVSNTTHFGLNPAIDAHWGMEKTYDYYKNKFSRLSYDGNDGEIISYYNPVFLTELMGDIGLPNNAMALPDPMNLMVFGPGDGSSYDPVVGIDVAGHEFTHLVMSFNNAGGLRYKGESGALNESFADIFGTSIEYYALGSEANWLIGEDIILYGSNNFMRSMSNPKILNDPNTYRGQYWASTTSSFDNGGVHINSSVQNYWFYLLVEGGSGVNDLDNFYAVEPIGRDVAEIIAYSNMMYYLPFNATYQNAYEFSLQLTADMFGEDSSTYNSVKNAWYAVGLGEAGVMGTKDVEIQSKLNVYPNPVQDGYVKIHWNAEGYAAVVIYDLLGKKVQQAALTTGENTLNLGFLKAGVYFLNFDLNGQSHVEKVIVK